MATTLFRLGTLFICCMACLFFQSFENKKRVAISEKTTIKNNGFKIIDPHHLFTIADAEAILGETAHLVDSASIQKIEQFEYKSSYVASEKEVASDKTRHIYFMLEHYREDTTAQRTFTNFKKANQNHKGFELLQTVGDEAFFHTDNKNFHLIIVRKSNKMIRIKVNKISKNTSVSALKATAKRIMDVL